MSSADDPSRPQEALPYLIELWRADGRDEVELVLARAMSVQLGRAIFRAATEEFPSRRITLRKGDQITADSAK